MVPSNFLSVSANVQKRGREVSAQASKEILNATKQLQDMGCKMNFFSFFVACLANMRTMTIGE